MSQLSYITENNQICIPSTLGSLLKGHTSIPWIQTSVEKAYQSISKAILPRQPSNQSGPKQTILKLYRTPFLRFVKEWWGSRVLHA